MRCISQTPMKVFPPLSWGALFVIFTTLPYSYDTKFFRATLIRIINKQSKSTKSQLTESKKLSTTQKNVTTNCC